MQLPLADVPSKLVLLKPASLSVLLALVIE